MWKVNSGIKPFNALKDERKMYELKKETVPGAGPLSIPNAEKTPNLHTAPSGFEKLRKILSKK